MTGLVLSLLITVSISWSLVHGNLYEITAGYYGDDCKTNSIYAVKAISNGGCSDDAAECIDDGSEFGGKATTICTENYQTTMRESLGFKYIIQELYSGKDCSTFEYAMGFVVTNKCAGGTVILDADTDGSIYVFTSILTTSGSASLDIYVYTKNQTEASCLTGRVGSPRANKTQLDAFQSIQKRYQ
ncbi:hypothetical protein V7S43_005088 [Phytophthora oleae]|uniref:Uncharacterized protein n=1 Tax=Phytophthora oleae TaxID=2107226 RepID=A0ABD3FRZ5_9STRA